MNWFRTMLLLAALTALFMALGYTIGGSGGAILAFVIALGMNLFTYWNADKIVLRMHDARVPIGTFRRRAISRELMPSSRSLRMASSSC